MCRSKSEGCFRRNSLNLCNLSPCLHIHNLQGRDRERENKQKEKNSKPVSTQSVGDKVKVETCQYSQYRRQNTGPNVSVHIV